MPDDWTIPALKEHFDVQLADMKEAVRVADAANEKRLDNVNEFRATLETQQATFVTKEQVRWAVTAMLAGIAVAVAIFAAVGGS